MDKPLKKEIQRMRQEAVQEKLSYELGFPLLDIPYLCSAQEDRRYLDSYQL